MNSTESESALAAGALFDDVIVPLALSRRARGAAPYFIAARDPLAQTYFSPVSSGTSIRESFDFPGGGKPEGLVESATSLWEHADEPELAAASGRMSEIASLVDKAAKVDDGRVDIFCYTLF